MFTGNPASTRFFFYKNIEIGESHAMFLTFSILRLKMFLTCSYFLAFPKRYFFNCYEKGRTCKNLTPNNWKLTCWFWWSRDFSFISPTVFTWFCCKRLFLFHRKKMSSFTKPCNVLSMFLNLEPWKPYVLISFVLIEKHDMYPVQVVSSISGNIITIILGRVTSFVNRAKVTLKKAIFKLLKLHFEW